MKFEAFVLIGLQPVKPRGFLVLFFMYEIKSIPTRYKGIVFRSRLEAYCYDYLISAFPEFDTMYEEELPFLEWVPDFMMVDYKRKFVILVEVKPDDKRAYVNVKSHGRR